MSIAAINAVGESKVSPSGRRYVLLALANFADEEWSCFPSVAQISAWTGQCEKTVRDHLDALEQTGVISRRRQRREDGTLGRYRFVIHSEQLRPEMDAVNQRQISPVADFASGRNFHSPAVNSATHNHQLEPPSNNTKARERTPRDFLLTCLDEERAEAVIDHRKKIRKPLTAHAAKLLAGKFAKWHDPNAAADAMIANGWQGFEVAWMENRNTNTRQGAPPDRPVMMADYAANLLKTIEANRNDEPADHNGPEIDASNG